MRINTFAFYKNRRPAEAAAEQLAQSPASVSNKLEALTVLANSILAEVESLKQNKEVAAQSRIDLAEEVRRYEMDLIRSALVRTGGRQRQAARLLNVKATTLNAKLKRYGIACAAPQGEDAEVIH